MILPDDLPDDEVVSTVLDGAATDANRLSVAADPELAARLAMFGALRDEIRDVAAPDDLLDQLRAAAVAAFARETPATPSTHRRPQLTTRWFAAAAAAAVLVAGIGLFAARGPGGSSAEDASRASSAGQAAAALNAGPRDLAGSGATGTGTLPSAKAAGVPERAPTNLGTVATLDSLAATYRAQVTRAEPAGAAGAPPIARCGTPVAEAILADTLVRLELHGDRVDVVEAATCTLIGSFTP